MNGNHFTLPDSLLARIDEFTSGGFVLLTIDGHGCPEIYYSFDNPASAFALQSHMLYWAKAFNTVNESCALKAITRGSGK